MVGLTLINPFCFRSGFIASQPLGVRKALRAKVGPKQEKMVALLPRNLQVCY